MIKIFSIFCFALLLSTQIFLALLWFLWRKLFVVHNWLSYLNFRVTKYISYTYRYHSWKHYVTVKMYIKSKHFDANLYISLSMNRSWLISVSRATGWYSYIALYIWNVPTAIRQSLPRFSRYWSVMLDKFLIIFPLGFSILFISFFFIILDTYYLSINCVTY